MMYFDSAATTFQKPPAVARAMMRAMDEMSSPGRGNYPAARAAAEASYACRSELAALFSVPSPEQVVFTINATHGLNIAIKSLVKPGDRVVISGYEHNAVTRPLAAIEGLELVVAEAPLFAPEKALEAFARAIVPGTKAVICNHVSNVFGYIQPIEEIAALCRARGAALLIDASQSAGVVPLSFTQLAPAFVAMPGHKGLYGPQGTGVLLCGSEGIPMIQGGTGSVSLQQEMPEFLPDRLEAGTHNMPGIAGLLEGVRFVRAMGERRIHAYEETLMRKMAAELREIPGVTLFEGRAQTGVLSLVTQGRDVEEIGELLSTEGIAVRAGLHCAPLAHRSAGTLASGTVRISFSAFNEEYEITRFAATFRDIMNRNS